MINADNYIHLLIRYITEHFVIVSPLDKRQNKIIQTLKTVSDVCNEYISCLEYHDFPFIEL